MSLYVSGGYGFGNLFRHVAALGRALHGDCHSRNADRFLDGALLAEAREYLYLILLFSKDLTGLTDIHLSIRASIVSRGFYTTLWDS